MSRYGKYDISGIKDGEPEPCPRVWDEKRKCWSDAWKTLLYDVEIKKFQETYERMNYRLSDKLSDPKKLIEIVEAGIENPEIATCAFAEVLEQLYHSDKYQTLITIDGYNTWYLPTRYPSFRYENSRQLKSRIPPYHLALIRLLMKFDG